MKNDTNDALGWSLLTSGVVTLLLVALPGDSLYWGLALLAAGVAVKWRRTTRRDRR